MPEMPFSSRLTNAEEERLVLLAEESGEIVQAVMKILRHGYASRGPAPLDQRSGTADPNAPRLGITNRSQLEHELGHHKHIIEMMLAACDIREENIQEACVEKENKIAPFLHFN